VAGRQLGADKQIEVAGRQPGAGRQTAVAGKRAGGSNTTELAGTPEPGCHKREWVWSLEEGLGGENWRGAFAGEARCSPGSAAANSSFQRSCPWRGAGESVSQGKQGEQASRQEREWVRRLRCS